MLHQVWTGPKAGFPGHTRGLSGSHFLLLTARVRPSSPLSKVQTCVKDMREELLTSQVHGWPLKYVSSGAPGLTAEDARKRSVSLHRPRIRPHPASLDRASAGLPPAHKARHSGGGGSRKGGLQSLLITPPVLPPARERLFSLLLGSFQRRDCLNPQFPGKHASCVYFSHIWEAELSLLQTEHPTGWGGNRVSAVLKLVTNGQSVTW